FFFIRVLTNKANQKVNSTDKRKENNGEGINIGGSLAFMYRLRLDIHEQFIGIKRYLKDEARKGFCFKIWGMIDESSTSCSSSKSFSPVCSSSPTGKKPCLPRAGIKEA
ncbi:hypothetical protein PENTCL1PPCAC_14132, partial [Pristionchus entomophagus]